ncbi:steroid hormone receptor ERR2 [Anopheles ziemanni]|uniref:steroid hormone receptor ERR2 n=2 Tax=coustani group TaxID=59130 RepID=UPI002658C567|nr:steroid hormone receptor ERR2 isoform X3 [Anopheles coustani]XP_058170220.1 steroid hormone receptor ERR2 [Anopheles ziemanni]
MQEVVSLMESDSTPARIKQELIETSCCSPSPSSAGSSLSQINLLYGNAPSGKMDFKCSNNNNETTQLTELHGSGSGHSPSNVKPQSPGSPDRQFCSSTTSAIGDFGSDGTNNDTIKEEIPRRLCLVCGDVASGFHYGVASCEACKAFFKRTIQGNIEYTCPASNDCEINKRRRKACQACRFRKCLLMGMLKEGVRLDRVRGGRQKYRRNPSANTYQMQLVQSNPMYTPQTLEDIKILEVLASFEPDPLSIGNCGDLMNGSTGEERSAGGATQSPNGANTVATSSSSSSSSTSNSSNSSASGATAAADSGVERMTVGGDAQEILSVLSDIYDKELVGVIGWAKQIPGFTDLPLNDQMRLLQVSWAELLTLMLAFRSIPFDGRLYFATDFWLDERSAKECGALDLYNHLAQITQRLEKISATKEEYYLLKALSLSNCDIRLDNYNALKKIRDSILYALNDCVLLLRQHQAVSHQQQLLLLLPSLRQADFIIRKFWTNVHIEGNVTMNKLFVEMLESVSR